MAVIHERECRHGCGHTVKATDARTADSVRQDHEAVCRRLRPRNGGGS